MSKTNMQIPAGAEIIVATVGTPGDGAATIILPGTTTETQAEYRYVLEGMELTAGERVYAIKVSGTYVLLGGTVGGGHGLPAGGSAGDALVKTGADDYTAGWAPLLYRGSDGGLCEVDEL